MENNDILMEEEESILTLTDENGEDMDFEYLDCIEYQGTEYLVLMPADEESNEIVILQIEPVDEEYENYLAIDDEETLKAVYEIFKERYKDVLTFADYDGCPIFPHANSVGRCGYGKTAACPGGRIRHRRRRRLHGGSPGPQRHRRYRSH